MAQVRVKMLLLERFEMLGPVEDADLDASEDVVVS